MTGRYRVTGLLILLFAITYIDGVCISVAGPRMQADLGIDPIGWSWVTAMFTLSYWLCIDAAQVIGSPAAVDELVPSPAVV